MVGGEHVQEECGRLGAVEEVILNLRDRGLPTGVRAEAAAAMWALLGGHAGNVERFVVQGGVAVLVELLDVEGGAEGDSALLEAREHAAGALGEAVKLSDEAAANLAAGKQGVHRLIKILNLTADAREAGGDTGGGQEVAAEALYYALMRHEDCRTQAARSGIRRTLEALYDSPLLYSPNPQERRMAEAAAWWAQVLIQTINVAPARGVVPSAPRGDSSQGDGAVFTQRVFRGFLARSRCKVLRSLPREQSLGVIRLQHAMADEKLFLKMCALEDVENQGGNVGKRASTMDQHEFIEAIRHVKMLGTAVTDRHKVSKTQAASSFRSCSGRANEILFPTYVLAMRRCLILVAGDAATALRLINLSAEHRGDNWEAKRGGGSAGRPAQRDLVGKKSLLNIMLDEPGATPPGTPGHQ